MSDDRSLDDRLAALEERVEHLEEWKREQQASTIHPAGDEVDDEIVEKKLYPDGTIKTIYADGSVEITEPDDT